MEINTVCISTKEYAEFIKLQMEHAEVKDALLEQVEMNAKLKWYLMNDLFYEWRVTNYSLEQMINYRDSYRFGFDNADTMTLLSYGVTIDEMVEFIKERKAQMDAKDREESENE